LGELKQGWHRLLPLLVCGFTVGCGSSSPYAYTKVSGKITYDDGSPIPGGGLILRFAAQDAPKLENAAPRPAFARTNAQGEFDSVTSYKYGDGLISGRHKVAIEPQGSIDSTAAVPNEYRSISATPLVIDTADLPLEIKVPKPRAK